jgi:hypothetical protein
LTRVLVTGTEGYLGALADRVVLLRGSDVEDIAVHLFARRVDCPDDRFRDVECV